MHILVPGTIYVEWINEAKLSQMDHFIYVYLALYFMERGYKQSKCLEQHLVITLYKVVLGVCVRMRSYNRDLSSVCMYTVLQTVDVTIVNACSAQAGFSTQLTYICMHACGKPLQSRL